VWPQPQATAIILGSSFPVGQGLGPMRLRGRGTPHDQIRE
jgi:hypothetical protein